MRRAIDPRCWQALAFWLLVLAFSLQWVDDVTQRRGIAAAALVLIVVLVGHGVRAIWRRLSAGPGTGAGPTGRPGQ